VCVKFSNLATVLGLAPATALAESPPIANPPSDGALKVAEIVANRKVVLH
jgi:hypothetical protein